MLELITTNAALGYAVGKITGSLEDRFWDLLLKDIPKKLTEKYKIEMMNVANSVIYCPVFQYT